MYVTAFNTSSVPVAADAEGRSIFPGEWGTVDTTSDAGKLSIRGRDNPAGPLIVQDEIRDDDQPAAVEARERTKQTADRAEKLGAVDKDILAQTARLASVPNADDLTKPELVAALAPRLDVLVPDPTPPPAGEVNEAAPPAEEAPQAVAADPPPRPRKTAASRQHEKEQS